MQHVWSGEGVLLHADTPARAGWIAATMLCTSRFITFIYTSWRGILSGFGLQKQHTYTKFNRRPLALGCTSARSALYWIHLIKCRVMGNCVAVPASKPKRWRPESCTEKHTVSPNTSISLLPPYFGLWPMPVSAASCGLVKSKSTLLSSCTCWFSVLSSCKRHTCE